MKNRIQLTETSLINLINKVINESQSIGQKEIIFKMEDIDNGFIKAKNIGFKGSKQTLINTANKVKGIVEGGGDTGHILSCPKCCHADNCFGACGGACCIGVKVKKMGEEVLVTVSCSI